MSRLELAGLLAVLALVAWTYAGAFRGFFVQDDFGWLETSRFTTLKDYLSCFFRFNPALSFRPLSQETFFWAGQNLFGLRPEGFHFLTLLTHLIGCSLLYVLMRQFAAPLPSLVATAFYGVHSAHVWSLYWIAAFPEPLALSSYLAALFFFVRFDRSDSVRAYGASLCVMGLGMLSKESILTLPLVLAAYCVLIARRRLRSTIPFFLLSGIYAYFRATSKAVQAAPYPLTFGREAWQNLLAYLSWLGGFSETIVRFRFQLEPDAAYGALALIVVGILGILLYLSRNRRIAIFAVIWMAIGLQPVLYFSNHSYPYYLAPTLAACALLLASALPDARSFTKARPIVVGLGVIAICVGIARASIIPEGRWWIERARISREILRRMPDVDRDVPAGKIAYIFGFTEEEFGPMQNDAAFKAFGFPPTRFILFGLDRETTGQIRKLFLAGDVRDYHAFIYFRGEFVNATWDLRRDPESLTRFEDRFLTNPEISWLKVYPRVVERGKDTMHLRLEHLSAPSIDLLYTIDGEPVPILHGWRLEQDGTAQVFVDQSTRKGLYHIKAIRDSREASALRWIPIDVQILVK